MSPKDLERLAELLVEFAEADNLGTHDEKAEILREAVDEISDSAGEELASLMSEAWPY